jgi:hypothetical protein
METAVLLKVNAPRLPVPMSATLCGEPTTKSLKTSVAVRVPTVVGTNVTATAQLAPAASEAPQVVEILKSLASEPASQMLEMLNALPPLFVSVTVCAAPAKPIN